jgi:serine protease Do
MIAMGVAMAPASFGQHSRAARTVVVSRSGSYLGIGGIDIDEERAKALNLKEARGVEIKSVDANSPASKAGLKDGDVVLDYNGQPVAGIEQFARLVRETPAGHEVRLQVWRGGAMQTITATIATRPGATIHSDGDGFSFTMPPMPPLDMPTAHMTWRSPTLGLETESLTPQLAEFFGVKEGVLVRAVTKNSAAEKAGIKAGDIVVKVDETKVTTPREITSALHSLRTKHTFPVVVMRNRQEMTFSVTIEERRGMRQMRPTRAGAIYC